MQRLHQNDPTGFLLSAEKSDWMLLKLPLIGEEDQSITSPVSGRVWKRNKGDLPAMADRVRLFWPVWMVGAKNILFSMQPPLDTRSTIEIL
jgi:hypothetical protein